MPAPIPGPSDRPATPLAPPPVAPAQPSAPAAVSPAGQPAFAGQSARANAFPGYYRMPAPAAPRRRGLGANAVALLSLAGFGAVCEAALALVGGVPGASVGALGLAIGAVWAVRWIPGAEAMESGYRSRTRLVGTREPTLRYWDAAISDAASTPEGYALHLHPLLLRLYEVRLAEAHGVALRLQPQRAAELIGPELWPWIDPSLPRSPVLIRRARQAGNAYLPDPRPVPPAVLDALVSRLETL